MERSLDLRLQPDASRYTLARFLEDVASRHGDRVAVRFEGHDVSYRDLHARARLLARALTAVGVVKGARVAVWMANRIEWIVSAFATGMTGAVLVPVNTFATASERDYILRHSDASVLLLQRTLLGHAFLDDLLRDHRELAEGKPGALACRALPCLRRIVVLETGQGGKEGRAARGAQRWQDLLELADEIPEALLDEIVSEVTPSDDGVIIYTSGTTAQPKGILHTQRTPVVQSWRFAELMELTSEDRVLTAQPFFWTAGMAMSLGGTLGAGATLILQETFDPERALACIESERVTTLHAWPHQEKAMAEHPSAASRDLSSLRRIEFSSPLAPLAGLEKDEWGTYGAYGLSETFTVAASVPASAPADVRRATSGKALAGIDVRIVDVVTGAPLARGSHGEIAVKGATLMRGYYKLEPELYLDDDGYFRTQDGGSLDDDGYLHWTGRLSNLVKTGGANVSPLEIDAALTKYRGLEAAFAVGVPHPTLGEAIVLCAVPSQGTSVDVEAIRAFLRSKLSAYKVPRAVLAFERDEIPYTANEKVQPETLRERALAKLAATATVIEGYAYQTAGK